MYDTQTHGKTAAPAARRITALAVPVFVLAWGLSQAQDRPPPPPPGYGPPPGGQNGYPPPPPPGMPPPQGQRPPPPPWQQGQGPQQGPQQPYQQPQQQMQPQQPSARAPVPVVSPIPAQAEPNAAASASTGTEATEAATPVPAKTSAASDTTSTWVDKPTPFDTPRSTAPVRRAPPVKTQTVDRFIETIPNWVWWIAVAFPIFLVLLGWSIRRQARLAAERDRMERQQRVLEVQQHKLRTTSEQLRHQATNDPLTGILNRRAFADELRKLLEHLSRFGRPLDLIVFDCDHFKQINDQMGHLAGDIALKLVSGVVHQHLNSDDLFGRFGGDEFLIACADRPPGETAAIAETIRKAVVVAANGATPPLTGLSLSLGIARATREGGYHLEDLFAHADTALYAAKRGGRNRVVVASEELPLPPAAETVTRQLA